jgi:Xaa-Pro dipeptidase
MSEELSMNLKYRDDPQLASLWDRLPHDRKDRRIISDAAKKRSRLHQWMERRGFDGVLISRRDNFAWLTGGGDSRVITSTDAGFGSLLITRDRHYLLAHSMDSYRLHEEQAPVQGYDLVTLRWHEGDPRHKAFELAGKRLASDTPLAGAEEVNDEITKLHYPLTDLEIDRTRWLARQTGLILEAMAAWVRPGMTEESIARKMQAEFVLSGIDLDVLIVGSDDRVFKYRHPLPTAKPVEKYVMLHPAARRWGLHANVTRSIHCGQPPERVRKAYDTAATMEAHVLNTLQPGVLFKDILQCQKTWYDELGYPGEWEYHFQGGPTAYLVADPTRCLTDTSVECNQAFDWFITVTGAKVEELTLLTEAGVEIASQAGSWPVKAIELPLGVLEVPDLWVFPG